MNKHSLAVNILGTSFTVQTNGDPQYLRRVVDYLDKRVQEIQSKYAERTSQDPVKISLLAGLNLVDELFRAREGGGAAADDVELERITERLIDTIDKSLMGN